MVHEFPLDSINWTPESVSKAGIDQEAVKGLSSETAISRDESHQKSHQEDTSGTPTLPAGKVVTFKADLMRKLTVYRRSTNEFRSTPMKS